MATGVRGRGSGPTRSPVGRGEARMRAFAYLTGITIGLIDGVLAIHIWFLGFVPEVGVIIASLSVPSLLSALLAPRISTHIGRRIPNCVGALSLALGSVVIASFLARTRCSALEGERALRSESLTARAPYRRQTRQRKNTGRAYRRIVLYARRGRLPKGVKSPQPKADHKGLNCRATIKKIVVTKIKICLELMTAPITLKVVVLKLVG